MDLENARVPAELQIRVPKSAPSPGIHPAYGLTPTPLPGPKTCIESPILFRRHQRTAPQPAPKEDEEKK